MNTRILSFLVLVSLSLAGAPAKAEMPEFPTPQPEHQWLKQFTGQWTSTAKTVALDDQPAMECTGSMKSHMLGGFWVINELEGDMAGTTFAGVQTIGYDPDKSKYVGTWVDSLMDHLWHYEGTVDDSGKKLVLIAKGPDMLHPGKLTEYRDSYEFKSPDRILATSEIKNANGEWITFMTGEMTRQ